MSEPRPRVVVVGTVAFDTVAAVDRLPGPDETARLQRRVERPGGAGGNVAMALARLGLEPVLLSCVGPDFEGSAYQQALASAGVNLDHLVVTEGPTSRVFLFTDSNERQQIYSDPGAAARMDQLSVPSELLEGPTLAHFAAGDLASYPKLMKSFGMVTFDPGQEVFQRDTAEVIACLPHVNVLFLNAHEMKHVNRNFDGALEETVGSGSPPRVLLISDGADGSHLHTPEGRHDIPAVPAVVQDPSGAGDAQSAGFLFGLAHGFHLDICGRVGAVVASFAVEYNGTQDGLPSLVDVISRYEALWGTWPS